ncbi:Wzz/FepE/Etk N-terminal domain-containing protein [Fibrivirga algicola]|uniref:Lipopolysaccharide biosynthesis protein n=1 Tax=Fibrivirga algicola TaxID=2950420 RepID=A0ABX0QHZ1_9BACT|nr:Wzz/FepE/Etk N-terminal domain-containing protein [Fibrivirga algicola]NID11667.1 lipopolysaccharide biosynthesis protein [Fibrivirga algicola]
MSTIEPTQRSTDSGEDVIEIRLSDIVNFLKRSRRAMILGAVVGGVLGALYAFSLPNQYTSQISVLPELQTKAGANLGSLGSLAGLAGIDVGSMGGGADAVKPDLYPNIINSVPFALSLFSQPVYPTSSKRPVSFATYWQQQQGTGLLSWLSTSKPDESRLPADTISSGGALQLTKAQEAMQQAVSDKVSASFEKKSGVLTIVSTMPDPVVAARVASLTLDYLSNYVTTYRTEKSRREVAFLTKQVSSAKQRYQAAEYALSAYRDQNRSVFLNTAKIEEQRIQAEFLLSQELYNTLSKQTEMARIKVQEETPVFKVLEPAQIPLRKSGPKRTIIMGISVLMGGIIMLLVKLKSVLF